MFQARVLLHRFHREAESKCQFQNLPKKSVLTEQYKNSLIEQYL